VIYHGEEVNLSDDDFSEFEEFLDEVYEDFLLLRWKVNFLREILSFSAFIDTIMGSFECSLDLLDDLKC